MSARIIVGDCRVSMAEMETASVDSIVCDPPYELGFMGKSWDASGIAYDLEVWRQALRVLKPGGYLLAFSATRTYHRMTCAIEDAGFEIRDCIGWHYGSGFPKSLDVSKAIDKAAGAQREVVGIKHAERYPNGPGGNTFTVGGEPDGTRIGPQPLTAPATDDARRWSGWGTALKPAWEPVVVARKPLQGTVAANVLRYGTGAINVDGCRVASSDALVRPPIDRNDNVAYVAYGKVLGVGVQVEPAGRWPANIILSHDPACGDECAPGCPCAAMDAHSGGDGASRFFSNLPIEADDLVPFFYAAKASRREREAGCDDLPARSGAEAVEREEGSAGVNSPRAGAGRTAASVRNNHPTVKPVSVMAWCIRLVTHPGGLVLDPFTGSGTTGVAARREGMRFVGCEMSEEYAEIARARIAHASGPLFNGGE
jgi:site-specific DNA-methyltransferase (adenine-specific)